MSISTSKSGKELERRGVRLSNGNEINGDHMFEHHVQVLLEESMVLVIYTNMVFVFAGEVTICMPYPLRTFQLVVLVHSTHSSGRKLKVGTSMEARIIWRTLGVNNASRTFKYRRFDFNVIHPFTLNLNLHSCSFLLRLKNRDTQGGNYNRGLPRYFIDLTMRGMYFWYSKMGLLDALGNEYTIQFNTFAFHKMVPYKEFISCLLEITRILHQIRHAHLCANLLEHRIR